MVLDCMSEGSLRPTTGDGWNAVLAVRLLHAQVRLRIMSKPGWSEEEYCGVPINQEDLLATQHAFGLMVLLAVERVGLRAIWQEMEDYNHLWRYIGWLMGVESAIVDAGSDIASSKAQLESILIHLIEPDENVAKMVNNVLLSIVNRPPRNFSPARTIALTRFFTVSRTRRACVRLPNS